MAKGKVSLNNQTPQLSNPPNIAVQRVAFLLCFRELPGSIHSPGYRLLRIKTFVVFLSSNRKVPVYGDLCLQNRDCRWNPDSITLKTERPRHERAAASGYRPAIFFRHLRLIMLSFPPEKKIGKRFKKCHFFSISLRYFLTACQKCDKWRCVKSERVRSDRFLSHPSHFIVK